MCILDLVFLDEFLYFLDVSKFINLHVSHIYVCSGLKEVVKKRLKNYWKTQKLAQSRLPTNREHKYDYILGNMD